MFSLCSVFTKKLSTPSLISYLPRRLQHGSNINPVLLFGDTSFIEKSRVQEQAGILTIGGRIERICKSKISSSDSLKGELTISVQTLLMLKKFEEETEMKIRGALMFLDYHWMADAVNGGSKFDDREPEFIELLNQARALRAEYLEGCISLPREFNTVANYVGRKLRGYPVDEEGVYYTRFVSNLLAKRQAQMLNDPSTTKEPAYYEFKIDKGDVFTYFKLCITPTGVVTLIEQVTYSDAALYPDVRTFIVRDLSGTD